MSRRREGPWDAAAGAQRSRQSVQALSVHVASRLAEALAVGGRAASESPQRAGVRTRLLWLRLTVR